MAVHAVGKLTVDAHQHVLGLFLDQRLCCQHMLDFGCANAVCERTERAMGRCMAVTTNNGHAGQREALLGTDNVKQCLAGGRLRRNIRRRNQQHF